MRELAGHEAAELAVYRAAEARGEPFAPEAARRYRELAFIDAADEEDARLDALAALAERRASDVRALRRFPQCTESIGRRHGMAYAVECLAESHPELAAQWYGWSPGE